MAKVSVTYRAPKGDTKYVEWGGFTFFDGQPVEIEDNTPDNQHLIKKASKNRCFEVSEMGTAHEVVEEEVEEHEHDDDSARLAATAGNAVAKTRAQIQFKVLAILTGGDVGSNPSAEDAAAIDGYIDSVVAELAGDTIVIENPDTLGDDIFVNFCKLVANAAAEEFGAKSDAKAAQAWHNNIRAIRRPMPGYGPQETTDY